MSEKQTNKDTMTLILKSVNGNNITTSELSKVILMSENLSPCLRSHHEFITEFIYVLHCPGLSDVH